MNNPKYSICMINLDMESYLEASILSIANQLDERFEIIVVDGGSKDGSVALLKKMETLLPNLRVFELPRENRSLGSDRNYSIMVAKGEYVLLHLDCDDLYYPFIKEWIAAFHIIEDTFGSSEILVAGCHINMGKRKFLMNHGPYKDLVFEDRELWTRMNHIGKFVKLRHKDFVTRMPLSLRRKILKIPKRILIEMTENLCQPQNKIISYILREISLFNRRSCIHFVLRIILLPFAIYRSLKKKKNTVRFHKIESFRHNSNLYEVSISDVILKNSCHIKKDSFSKGFQAIFFDNKI